MLDQLKRFFNVVEKEPEMVNETLQAPTLADNTAELASVQAALAAQAEAFTTVKTQLAEVTEKFEKAEAALAAVAAEKAEIEMAAKAKVSEVRLSKLVATIGEANAPKIAAFLENADDATFETVLSSYAMNLEAEAKSEKFKEVGLSADEPTNNKPVHFNTFIKKD